MRNNIFKALNWNIDLIKEIKKKIIMPEKWEVFIKEINLIKDEKIKEFTKKTLNNSPDYFFTAPASSTGKYHPQCTLKTGGLIVHVKRAVYIVDRLAEGWGIFNLDRDIVLSATILHDIAKTGQGGGSYADYENHPINAVKYFVGIERDDVTTGGLDLITANIINDCVRYHMGRWTPASIKKEIKDYSLMELIVYTADYIASTKDLVTPKDGE